MKVFPDVYRGLVRQESARFRASFLADLCDVEIRTPAGLVIPRKGYYVHYERLFRVVRRVVRGLYYKLSGTVLPSDQVVKILNSDELPFWTEQARSELQEFLSKYLLGQPLTAKGDVFAYRCRIDVAVGSVWLLSFYKSTHFVVITANKGQTLTAE